MNRSERAIQSNSQFPAERNLGQLKSSASRILQSQAFWGNNANNFGQQSARNHTLSTANAVCACPGCVSLLEDV